MKGKRRILVVDSDRAVVTFLQRTLRAYGYETVAAFDGSEGLEAVNCEVSDLVVLDMTLPVIDGLTLCTRIREWSSVPVIVLSSRADQADKVHCLDAGADDYITKPFGTEELMARIRTAFRHVELPSIVPPQPAITFGNVTVDIGKRRVTVADQEVKLTPLEYGLLKELVLNKGRVLTHQYLLTMVWGSEYAQETDYLHVFIRRVRRKIEPEPSKPRYFISVSGVGYRFVS